nr:HpcH/HpaI aldolase/citrate lyase family protein [Rhizobium leguminosarum]
MALKNTSPYELGATLYMPILKPDALDYIAGTKIPKLRSMVLCLEDALLENDVLEGMDILEKTLIRIGQVKRDSTETRFPLGCCHVKFLWLERSAARGYSGDTGRVRNDPWRKTVTLEADVSCLHRRNLRPTRQAGNRSPVNVTIPFPAIDILYADFDTYPSDITGRGDIGGSYH